MSENEPEDPTEPTEPTESALKLPFYLFRSKGETYLHETDRDIVTIFELDPLPEFILVSSNSDLQPDSNPGDLTAYHFGKATGEIVWSRKMRPLTVYNIPAAQTTGFLSDDQALTRADPILACAWGSETEWRWPNYASLPVGRRWVMGQKGIDPESAVDLVPAGIFRGLYLPEPQETEETEET